MVTLEKVPFIEALESEVVELHRSPETVAMAVEGPAPLAVQAFACVLKREGEYLVQAALYCKEIKRALIYRIGSSVDGTPPYRELLARALRFAETVGCRMEAVNLKYSAAMRGVILKEIAVLTPPGAARKALLERASARTELERVIAGNDALSSGEEDDSDLPPEKRIERRHHREAQAARAEAAARRLAAEKRIDELEEIWSRKVAPIVDGINGVKPRAATPAPAGGEDDPRLGELAEKARQLERQVDAERTAREKLQQAKDAADKRIAELQQSVKRAEEQAQAAARSAGKNEAAGRMSGRVGELEEMLRQARSETAAERQERERLARDLGKTQERLSAFTPGEPGTVDRRVAELEEALRQAEERAEFLRHEVERLAAAKAQAEKRAAELAKDPVAANGNAIAPLQASPPSRTEAGPDPRALRRPPPPGAFFRVDWDLTAIPCDSAKAIGEIHRSTGMVKLSLEGYPNQYCCAFIVVLKKGEAKEIYMPFRLSAGNQLLVYVPAKQPKEPAAFSAAMKEAGKFLQVVGMDVEPVPVGKTGKLPPEIETLFSFGMPPGT